MDSIYNQEVEGLVNHGETYNDKLVKGGSNIKASDTPDYTRLDYDQLISKKPKMVSVGFLIITFIVFVVLFILLVYYGVRWFTLEKMISS